MGSNHVTHPSVSVFRHLLSLLYLSELYSSNKPGRARHIYYILFSDTKWKFEPQSSQTKDFKIDICCFSAKHAALRRKSKDRLARNQNNLSEWSDMSTRGLLFQWDSTINIQLSALVEYKADLIIISLKINLFSPWNSWKIAELALSNNPHSPNEN